MNARAAMPPNRRIVLSPVPENNPHNRPVTAVKGARAHAPRQHKRRPTGAMLRGVMGTSPYYANHATVDRRWDK